MTEPGAGQGTGAGEARGAVLQVSESVRAAFGRVYAALRARELLTLRQMRAIQRQCEASHTHKAACVANAVVLLDNEELLLAEIERFGALDLTGLSVEGEPFVPVDYVSPEEDHMYSYKCIDELSRESQDQNIAEELIRCVTATDGCVCSVRLTPEEVSKHFREDLEPKPKPKVHFESQNPSDANTLDSSSEEKVNNEHENISVNTLKESPDDKDGEEVIKNNPTQEWLNSIKSQTETEPSQLSDVMEHSRIVC